MAVAKLTTLLRKAAARTRDAPRDAIGARFERSIPTHVAATAVTAAMRITETKAL